MFDAAFSAGFPAAHPDNPENQSMPTQQIDSENRSIPAQQIDSGKRTLPTPQTNSGKLISQPEEEAAECDLDEDDFAAPADTEFQLTADAGAEGRRADAWLSGLETLKLSRSYLAELIRGGRVLVNGKPCKPSLKLRAGDALSISVPAPRALDICAEDIPLDIVYEDSDLLIVNKPKDMVVHPSSGHLNGTLVNALMYHCRDALSSINGALRPGIVHRIDKDTTGLLVVCKNNEAHNSLAAQLKEHSITRCYAAIVYGNFQEDEGTVDAPIGRSRTDRKKQAIDRLGGRRAVTHYQVLERFGSYTLIECRLETGRTHQIRVHMASIGHPLLGDEVYGPKKCPFPLQGQCLHAGTLGFIHPRTGAYVEFHSDYPAYFAALLEKLRARR